MAYCLEAAKKFKKKVLVLDRPNPVGGTKVEGNCLSTRYRSFVGRYPIPMRHGLTIAELSMLFNEHFGIKCDLEVLPMSGWRRWMNFEDTGIPWVAPSPNLPTLTSALVYPGQVIWEGTNVSEGRGTTQPFEFFGAPFIDPDKMLSTLGGNRLGGAILRKIIFEPTSNKWMGKACNGFQIHVTDPAEYSPFSTSLRLLQAVIRHHADRFKWKSPPYEYEYEKLPIDLIIGDKRIRQRLENLEQLEAIQGSWKADLEAYQEMIHGFYLYP
jgi:uncharacterized protein YbbC (DUF1343 family)